MYGFLSNDPIKNLEPKDFNEFRGKLWDCASVYYYSKLLDTDKEPTAEELNKMFWLGKRHIEMINEINSFKKTMIFDPEFQIMDVINSPH